LTPARRITTAVLDAEGAKVLSRRVANDEPELLRLFAGAA
jgi:hypothetical protein